MKPFRRKKNAKKFKRPWSYDEPSLALRQIDQARLKTMIHNGYSRELAETILISEVVKSKLERFYE